MADAPPPPYSAVSNEKGGPYPPPGPGGFVHPPAPYPSQGGYPSAPPQGPYPPQQAGYPPQQAGYPPQQAGYPPAPQGYQAGPPPPGPPGPYGPPLHSGTQHSTVVVTQPVTVSFHERPAQTLCPHCRAQIVTATHYETGTFSWLICVILCLVGCNLGCCLIPFCVDGCQDVVHTCPNCKQIISRWHRM